MTPPRSKLKDLPWNTLWLILTFILGSLGHAAMQFGSTSNRLDQIALQVTGMNQDLKAFYARYAEQDKATSNAITRLQDQVDRLGSRVDKVESR